MQAYCIYACTEVAGLQNSRTAGLQNYEITVNPRKWEGATNA